MVDNRGISPLSNIGFKADNSSANKMSEEKQGQGGEYFAQDLQEDEDNLLKQPQYQDRSAQLRASLDGLAMSNAGSIMLMKALKEKEEKKKKALKSEKKEIKKEEKEETLED